MAEADQDLPVVVDSSPKNPLRDLSFWAALLPLLAAFAPAEVRSWVTQNPEALAPLVLWLATHGWLRRNYQRALQEAGADAL